MTSALHNEIFEPLIAELNLQELPAKVQIYRTHQSTHREDLKHMMKRKQFANDIQQLACDE
jgi:hypothetical protein